MMIGKSVWTSYTTITVHQRHFDIKGFTRTELSTFNYTQLEFEGPKKLKPRKNPQNSERNLRTLLKNQKNLENLKRKY